MGLFSSLGKVVKSSLGAISGAVGTAIGGPVGGIVGSTAGSLLSGDKSSNGSGSNSLVQGAIGLGSDLLSGWWNTGQQKSLNEEAFNQNLRMWNLQNAYNDPVAQMQRLSKAGLNPNLVYGGGNVTGNTTSNYPTIEPVKYSGIGEGMNQFLNRSQQKEIAMANLELGMQEFQQRVTNQGIQNYIALEKLKMYDKINKAMLGQYGVNTKGKQLENEFNEHPIQNLGTARGINMITNIFGKLLNAF